MCKTTKRVLWQAVALVGLLWTIIFAWQPLPFWVLMTLALVALVGYGYFRQGTRIFPEWPSNTDLWWGVASALILYGIFWLGYLLGSWLFPTMPARVAEVYALTEGQNPWIIAITLLLVVGPGEEIFWRGFLQKNFQKEYSPAKGLVITWVVYTVVHVVTGNWVLVGAASVAGLFWGTLFFYKQSLSMVVISHAFWDILILLMLPIR